MTRSATIIATGRYVPEFEHTNAMFKEQLNKINPKLGRDRQICSGI